MSLVYRRPELGAERGRSSRYMSDLRGDVSQEPALPSRDPRAISSRAWGSMVVTGGQAQTTSDLGFRASAQVSEEPQGGLIILRSRVRSLPGPRRKAQVRRGFPLPSTAGRDDGTVTGSRFVDPRPWAEARLAEELAPLRRMLGEATTRRERRRLRREIRLRRRRARVLAWLPVAW